MIWK